jgi:DNA-binding transcriptional LysR family regulator
MDSRQLEYFVAVAEERNFTRAAARLFAAQSTVSAGIAALERELGGRLFERDAHGVRLTGVGEAALPEARTGLQSIERLRDLVVGEGPLRGAVRVGIFTNLTSIDLPGIMGEFRRRHPGVDLRLGPSPSGSTGLADDVRQGRLDVAFLGLPDPAAGVLELSLAETPFVAVLPEGHPLAAGDGPVALQALAAERWVDAREGFGNRVTLDRALTAAGLSRQIATEVSDLGEIPRFVAAGLGVAALPALTVLPARGAVVRPLAPAVEWHLSVIVHPRPGAAARALVGLIAERFGRAVPPTLEAS